MKHCQKLAEHPGKLLIPILIVGNSSLAVEYNRRPLSTMSFISRKFRKQGAENMMMFMVGIVVYCINPTDAAR